MKAFRAILAISVVGLSASAQAAFVRSNRRDHCRLNDESRSWVADA